jgi:thiosulfate/3-mercaptopyruvate sulfurtransferase
MAFRTLISTSVLAAHLDDPAFCVIDCRYKLDDEEWGGREYATAHIPGAVYAHLGHDLSGPKTGTNGRHPLPDPHTFAQTLGRLGVTSGIQVVAYDQDNGMYASRLWWLLRWMAHGEVAVLDGGLAKWRAEERPTASGAEQHQAREFAGAANDAMAIDAEHVASLVGAASWRLVDARAPERFRGDSEPIDKVGGHIPGAVNHFFQWNLAEDGTFRSPEQLRERVRESIGDAPADRVVCYCGSGVTACHNLLALEHAGVTGARLYPGSWSEWSSDPARAVEKGSRIG